MQATRAPADEVQRLRAQLERIQGRTLDAPVLPVAPPLAELLPGKGLRPGAAYSVPRSMSLLFGLLAQASQAGSWCGVVGMPRLGAEAAESMGVDLSRLVLVPDPGARWLTVTATIADVLPIVAVRPAGRAPDGQIARLAGRLRERGAVLLVQGPWPQAEATLEVGDVSWSGLGRGHGYLAERTLTVTSTSRRWPVARRSRMLLPDAQGGVAGVGGHGRAASATDGRSPAAVPPEIASPPRLVPLEPLADGKPDALSKAG